MSGDPTTKTYYTSRTPMQAYQRCKRLRWLSTYEGAAGVGLEPVRKSIHLVVGSAVHAGMEVLLGQGQRELDNVRDNILGAESTIQEQLEFLFVGSRVDLDGTTLARNIEDAAVEAALADFAKEFGGGVELDPEEAAALAAGQAGVDNLVQITGLDLLKGQLAGSLRLEGADLADQDSPIIIDFGDLAATSVNIESTAGTFADMTIPMVGVPTMLAKPQYQSNEDYLREELQALVEGMTRAWARRRWRPLLEQFEVLEVEREGEWRLAKWGTGKQVKELVCDCGHRYRLDKYYAGAKCPKCASTNAAVEWVDDPLAELHFLSRHDALLLERSTQYLYLQSFKTTGTWDRRKELDAQVDMQGLSEGVDVERRFAEAWEHLQVVKSRENASCVVCDGSGKISSPAPWRDEAELISCGDCDGSGQLDISEDPEYLDASQRVRELVSDRVAHWLRSQPDPPRILGVRYEYLLKGSRKKDKRDPQQPERYVQESILIRAWKQEGITSDDRRWAWTWDWHDISGKSRRLPWQSWHRAPVWKSGMTIAEWVDRLDRGEVQGDALDERGERMDALSEQFVPVLTIYRNFDELLDLQEQMEAQEVQVIKDVAAVREAERLEGYAGKRSALNRFFPQTRTACSYPGLCEYRTTPTKAGFCFGPPDPYHDSMVLEHFRTRQANHPKELAATGSEAVE